MSEYRNPSVNRALANKEMSNIHHALGCPVDPMRVSYRNYFAVNKQGANDFTASAFWDDVTSAPKGLCYFSVNDAGRRALANYLSEIGDKHRAYEVKYRVNDEEYLSVTAGITRANAAYRCWLKISDCADWLTFAMFQRGLRVRLLPTNLPEGGA